MVTLQDLMAGVSIKAEITFGDGRKVIINQTEFKLIGDQLGFLLLKNGSVIGSYAIRSGVSTDIMIDFREHCIGLVRL